MGGGGGGGGGGGEGLIHKLGVTDGQMLIVSTV